MWQATDCIKAVDVWAANLTPQVTGTFDTAGLLAAHPNIKIIIARMYGGDSGPDRTYSEVVYSPGVKVEPYLVVSPNKNMTAMFTGWDAQLDTSRPKVIWADCERKDGKSVDFVTGYIQDVIAEARRRWTWAKIGIYTGAWIWDGMVRHGWEGDIPLWDGHYIWQKMLTPTTGEQYHDFNPLILRLPIGNSFTPLIPLGWKGVATPVVWQFSDQGSLPPVPRKIDLNLVSRTWYASVYGSGPVVPPVEPLTVEVRYPHGVHVLTTEVQDG